HFAQTTCNMRCVGCCVGPWPARTPLRSGGPGMSDAVKETREPVYGTINEEGLDRLRARMGVEHPIAEPFLRYVNDDSIRHVARAIGDANPLWADLAYGAGTRYGA